jgi:hypothetical protein
MNKVLEQDLKTAYDMMNNQWDMQSNEKDETTRFIYNAKTLEECLKIAEEKSIDKNYALHRWYNYMTSLYCEEIFCEYGAVHDKNKYNHDIDIYIGDVPFDVKLTVYPTKLSHRPFDLSVRKGQDDLIRWFYEHQSQGNRKQLCNRLYVVCDGQNNLKMKSDFSKIRQAIRYYMSNVEHYGVLHKIAIEDNEQIYEVYSDIVIVR